MIKNESKIKSKNMIELLRRRLKERYIYIIIMTIIFGFFTYIYNEANDSYVTGNDSEVQMPVLDNEIRQDIDVEHNDPKGIIIRLGKHKKIEETSNYNINVFNGDDCIVDYNLDLSTLDEDGDIGIVLPRLENRVRKLTIQIKSDVNNVNKELSLNTFKNSHNSMYINGVESDESLSTIVIYSRFPMLYRVIVVSLYIILCLIIVFIDIKQIHNSVFAIIIILGSISAIFNPILDTPDEQAHIARAELTSRGTFFATGNVEDFNVSKSLESIRDNMYKTFESGELVSTDENYDYTGKAESFAETNIFISYIPQALGILLAKILKINTFSIITFGRLFNLFAYALMVRYALKIAPNFKVPMAVVATMPMIIFISASFNPDASTYGLTFLLIGYFLKIYDEENITIKQIAVYAVISILLGFVKLPYCALGGLIIFIPKEKFENKKVYYKSFLFVFLIAFVSLTWGVTTMMGNSGASSHENYYVNNNVSVSDQISYIIHNPIVFTRFFAKSLFDNMHGYMNQINSFGWFSYSLNPTLMMLYPAFLIMTLFGYPTNLKICKKTKVGSALVVSAVFVLTNLILYLSWTPVGSTGIQGVQGRYFCSLVVFLALFSNKQLKDFDEEKMNYKYIFIALMFLAIYLVTLLNRAY